MQEQDKDSPRNLAKAIGTLTFAMKVSALANITRSHQRNVSSQVISKLKLLMISFGVASRFDREKWQAELSPILNLWKKLNQGSSMLQLKLQFPQGDPSNPIKSFVQLEQFNGVSLLQNIHKSLAGLSKVIRGSSLLNEKVSKLAASLLQQETPAIWHKLWSGPENPMDYIKTIVYCICERKRERIQYVYIPSSIFTKN